MDTHTLTWPKEGNSRVPYRVFSDADIYKAELDRLFLGPTWQYLAMANELPNPGDYKTTFLGETPVIEETFGDELVDDVFWNVAEFHHQLVAEPCHAVVTLRK